ncbi:MAG: substrate-binding domain-containing protein [Ignavibacteriaceae bacterium]|nr:substrate-binding domain-containing protein [Ignavibacteriaceae bacterium]
MKNRLVLICSIILSFLFFRCSNSDTPTTGKLTISVDETFKPLIESEIDTFHGIYSYTEVKADYKAEMDVFNDLMNDSVRLIIVPRKLNSEETKIFEQWEIVPKVTKIAYDAVAIIGSLDLKDSTLNLSEINKLISGSDLPNFKNINVVFDNNNSSTLKFLMEKTQCKQLSSRCYALNSNNAVIDYVSKQKNCLGVIGVNWISDRDDTTNLSFLKSVRVFEISNSDNSEAYKPYQAYIAQKAYPLWREVYIISKEAYTGLGTGFTAFVASERGQRIVLKYGLVPATMPVRLVEIINEEITE